MAHTPLTDAIIANKSIEDELDALRPLARRLETDRAELLEALRAIVDGKVPHEYGWSVSWELLKEADFAIKKATGG